MLIKTVFIAILKKIICKAKESICWNLIKKILENEDKKELLEKWNGHIHKFQKIFIKATKF